MSLLNYNIRSSWTWRLLVLAYTLSDAFPCVFVTSCSFVEFHIWESLGLAGQLVSTPECYLFCDLCFRRTYIFYYFGSFIRVEIKELCLDCLYHHSDPVKQRALTINYLHFIILQFHWCPLFVLSMVLDGVLQKAVCQWVCWGLGYWLEIILWMQFHLKMSQCEILQMIHQVFLTHFRIFWKILISTL